MSVLVFLIAVVVAVGIFGILLKRTLLGVVPSQLDFHAVSPTSYPSADLDGLARYTAAFAAEGFVHVGDYGLTARDAVVQPGFARLLVHPENGCYVEANQLFPAGRAPTPLRALVATAFDDGWTLATTDRAPDPVIYALRRPKALWTSEPDAPPDLLLARHFEARNRLERDLGLRPHRQTSREAYFARQREEAVARKALVRRRNVFLFVAEILRLKGRVPNRWLGES